MIAALGVGAVLIGGAAHGVYYHNSPLFGRAIHSIGSNGKRVALTFDDGPNPDATPLILDALAERNVKATFFILGKHAEKWPELVRRVAREGHTIGNHGYYHRKLHVKSPSYVRRDLTLGTQVIEKITGVHPHFFRAPHGFRNPWVSHIAQSLGQRTVGWSFGVWDSARPGADVIVQRILKDTKPGSILLLHDGDGYDPDGDRMQTAQAVPKIVDALQQRGYMFDGLPA